MNTTFDTLDEALEAGFTHARAGGAVKDTSEPNSFGYDFTDTHSGAKAVAVWLRQGKNKIGGMGCIVMMFPPR